jgi:phosphoribosylanthranilate isomerase
LLLDGHAQGEQGGRGKTFDWSQAVRAVAKPVVLAGGLTAHNVGAAIRGVRPYAVDVSSGVESAPGIKDAAKLRAFVDAVRVADSA